MTNRRPPRKAPDQPWRTEGSPGRSRPSRRPAEEDARRLAEPHPHGAARLPDHQPPAVLLQRRTSPRSRTPNSASSSTPATSTRSTPRATQIQGELKKAADVPDGGKGTYEEFTTQRPSFADDKLWDELTKQTSRSPRSRSTKSRSLLTNLLISLLPILLLVGLWMFMARRMAAGMGGGAGGMLGRKQPPKPVELDERQTHHLRGRGRHRRGRGRAERRRRLPQEPRPATGSWAPGCPAACSSRARPAPARRSSRGRSPVRRGCRSSRPPPRSSSR